MKYRLGFVTNSSSSSYIFGRPNENTITIKGVWEFIKDSATKLLSIIDYLDELVYATPGVSGDLKRLRAGDDSYELKNKIHQKLDKLYGFQYELKSQFKMHDIVIEDSDNRPHNIHYFYFMCSYFDNAEVEWIRQIANGSHDCLDLDIIDFRNSSDNYYQKLSLLEMLRWYRVDISEEEIEEISPYQLAYQYLGEVALFGENDYSLPSLLVNFLYCKLKYACRHMG